MDKWLTVSSIKRYSLSDRTPVTVRRALNRLVEMGLLDKIVAHQLYDAHIFKAKLELYPAEPTLVAMIDGQDMKHILCYTEAAILNKFRQMAQEERKSINISASDIRNMIHSDKSSESIRLKLRKLEKMGYIKSALKGRIHEYELNHDKLLGIRAPEIIDQQGNELTDLFIAHRKHHGYEVKASAKTSWRQTFKSMLMSGYCYNTIRHIVSYLSVDSYYLELIKSPAVLRRHYEKLYIASYGGLSIRSGKRRAYKLLNGLLYQKHATATSSIEHAAEDKAVVPLTPEEAWLKVEEWAERLLSKRKRGLRPWWEKSLAGVTDIDYEDYFAEAKLIMYRFFTKPPRSGNSHKYSDNWLHKRLDDFMLERRWVAKKEKKETLLPAQEEKYKNPILLKYVEQDYLEQMAKTEQAEDGCNESVIAAVHAALGHLPEKDRNIVMDYYGFDGKTHTFEDLRAKYGHAISWLHKIVKRSEARLRELFEPPDG